MKGSEGTRMRRTEAQWREVLDRFEASGLSQAAFCQREGVSVGSLTKWRRRLMEGEAPAAGAFVELAPTPEPALARELELLLPGGVVLRWKG